MRALCVTLLALLAVASPSRAGDSGPAYGPMLEGFAYPWPIQRLALRSQGQDLSMAYLDVAAEAPANGRSVVLLHGKNFCAATWEQTIRELTAKGYRVIAPDQIGFCASSKPRGYQFSFQQLAANTLTLLDRLQIEKVSVVAHSMGGMLGTRIALTAPQRVQRLVMVNPIGLEDWQALGVPYATIDALYQSESKTTFESIKAYQLKFYYDGQWRAEYDRWVDMQAGLYAGPGREAVAFNQAQASEMIFTQPVVHEFPRLRVPVVLMIGGKDRTAPGANRAPAEIAKTLGDYPELGKRTAAAIPGARLVEWPDLGHSPQIEAPDVFHPALLEALKD